MQSIKRGGNNAETREAIVFSPSLGYFGTIRRVSPLSQDIWNYTTRAASFVLLHGSSEVKPHVAGYYQVPKKPPTVFFI
jgi:hypothetical protein